MPARMREGFLGRLGMTHSYTNFVMVPKILVENISEHPEETSLIVAENEVLYYLVYGFAEAVKHVNVKLNGRGAEAYILGILVGQEGRCGLRTLQDHTAPDTKSDLLVRSVLGGNAALDYQGKIVIERDAQRSNAYQRNENILMSNRAHVDTKPELEILANDVRCTHGATVGKLEDEPIFYLQSRGLPEKEAERLILEGFINDVLAKIPDEQIKSNVHERLMNELVRSV